jgi:hypothetical protein
METDSTKAKAAAKKDPKRVALVDRYLTQYPKAKAIRAKLIADSTMGGSKLADAVRNFMDKRIGA